MDRLTDLNRLMDIAKAAGDTAEIAKLQGKIDKTLVDPAYAANAPVEPASDFDEGEKLTKKKRS